MPVVTTTRPADPIMSTTYKRLQQHNSKMLGEILAMWRGGGSGEWGGDAVEEYCKEGDSRPILHHDDDDPANDITQRRW